MKFGLFEIFLIGRLCNTQLTDSAKFLPTSSQMHQTFFYTIHYESPCSTQYIQEFRDSVNKTVVDSVNNVHFI